MTHRTREGHVDQFVVLDADHHVALPLHDRLNGHGSHARGQDAILCRGRSAALDMSQDRDARVVLRELFFTRSASPMAPPCGIFGHDDDRRVLALAETLADEFGQLVDFRVHFGDDGRFGTGGDRTVEGQVSGRVSHYLDEEEPFVARRRIAQFVDGLHDRVERRVVTDRGVRTAQVVVDRTGQPHDGMSCSCAKILAPDSEPSPPMTTSASIPAAFRFS